MKQTTNYKLHMPEMSDALSPTPLNENAQLIDTALKELNDGVMSRLKIAYGSYEGNDKLSVSISTPGIKPLALLISGKTKYSTPSSIPRPADQVRITDKNFSAGFVVWLSQDIPVSYWVDDGEVYDQFSETYVSGYKETAGSILFTSTKGKLSWKLSGTPTEYIKHSGLVNNQSGKLYEWIALGMEE